MLTFDDATHTYRWKGIVVPSVTQVLSDLMDWSHVPPDALEKAQLRGTNVHLMCQFHDEDRLDLDEFTPEERSYLEAWVRFLNDYRPSFQHIEVMGYHERLGFAGTPDRDVAFFEGQKAGTGAWVIDIKTGAEHPLQGLQTVAYDKLRGLLMPRCRATVHLSPGGVYKFREWTDPNDWPTFVSLLTVRSWTRKHL